MFRSETNIRYTKGNVPTYVDSYQICIKKMGLPFFSQLSSCTEQPEDNTVLYLMFDTSHMQLQPTIPYSSQSLTFGIKSVHCQSYDSVCINKHFPMNGVTPMFQVPRMYTV